MHEVPYRSVPGMIRENAVRFAGRTAISYKKGGQYISLTYEHFYERVLMAARGLRKAGVSPGDRVAIFSENRAGWAISDIGSQAARAITVPIYATNTPEQAAYVINHAEAKIVFVSNRVQYEKLLKIREQIPGVRLVVSYERFMGDLSFPVYTLYQLSEISHPLTPAEKKSIEDDIEAIGPDDVLSIIYTSGTTGPPKGVVLSHGNMLFDAYYGSKRLGDVQREDVFLSFLPLSHVLERTAGYHAPLMLGAHVAFAESVEKVVENMQEVRPTTMVCVPRLFEKIYARIHENVHQMNPLRRRLFFSAVEMGRRYVELRYVKRQPAGGLALRYRLADRLVFRKIRQKFGGRLRFCISGGAPLDKTINEFMWVIGIPVFEGYGLTETSPALTLSTKDALRFGSVGKALEKTELALAADGELLVRGPQVMRGYYRSEEETAAVFQDGWLKTGDIARIDGEGFVHIIDRKKEIIITSGGKNIAPQPIESELKLDKYISQAMVYGDGRPYLVALLTPYIERLLELAQQENIHYFDVEDLVSNEKVLALFEERIAAVNGRLPSYETIKKFALIPRDFSVDGGELTPTLKLKRKVIYQKYQDKIDRLYLEPGNGFPEREASDNGGNR
ncbi:long-chain fatty acid--CoA ligase [Desulfuromonas sp. KJ2020]|uniref:AMP-dependent synthetase/ligase n=1 Tax=Desulfuromonas sp. KJ2020 TaxID=2919173 RepID=UPI0020A781FD|nr:long-chain fatty acid--CoA ligase [Desulfuromonas sp. KJ2020]MCP3178362.1 long-chain fatty acid--CoA ligase [Desulfuromonas sp. KJ2020]